MGTTLKSIPPVVQWIIGIISAGGLAGYVYLCNNGVVPKGLCLFSSSCSVQCDPSCTIELFEEGVKSQIQSSERQLWSFGNSSSIDHSFTISGKTGRFIIKRYQSIASANQTNPYLIYWYYFDNTKNKFLELNDSTYNNFNNWFSIDFGSPGIYRLKAEIHNGQCTPHTIDFSLNRLQPSTSSNAPNSQVEGTLPTEKSPTLPNLISQIYEPTVGSQVNEYNSVRGSINGLDKPIRAFLVTRLHKCFEKDRELITSQEIASNGEWAFTVHYGDHESGNYGYEFDTFVVATANKVSANILAGQEAQQGRLQYQDFNLLTDISYISPIVIVRRENNQNYSCPVNHQDSIY